MSHVNNMEEGKHGHTEMTDYHKVIPAPANPTWQYLQNEEHVRGFFSKQFPTIANPAPLGLCGFALTTFVLSMYNAGAIINLDSPGLGVVMGLAMFYGGLCQLLAGMWEFKTGNTFGAVAFSSYGGFWMSFAALFVKAFGFLEGYGDDVTDLNYALGIYLMAWGIFSLLMMIAAHRTTVLLVVLFFTVFMTFLMLSIGKFKMGDLYFQRAGGVFGIIAAAQAWYGAMAALLTSKQSVFQLPVGEMDPILERWGLLKPEQKN